MLGRAGARSGGRAEADEPRQQTRGAPPRGGAAPGRAAPRLRGVGMSESIEANVFRQVVVLVVDGAGVAALPDAANYRDRGAATLPHVATYAGGLELPLFQWMGLGNVAPMRGVDAADPPAASVGVVGRETAGVDTEAALAEMLGGTCRSLVAAGLDVVAVGRAADLFEADEATVHQPGSSAREIMESTVDAVALPAEGLIVAVVGGEHGHAAGAHGPVSMSRTLLAVDSGLGPLLDVLAEDALLLVTSTGGADATLPAKEGPTREYAPLLAYTPLVPSGVELGTRGSLADIAATLAENFGLDLPEAGESFSGPLLS